jgi:cell wall-associated NlpC family hydrolase
VSAFRDRFLIEAVKYIGTPYQFSGQSDAGLDCSGFAIEVLRDLGFNVPDMTAHQLAARLFNCPQACRDGSIQAIFLVNDAEYSSDARVSHIGYMLEDDVVIHASEKYGRVYIQSMHKFEHDFGTNYFQTWCDMCELNYYWADDDPHTIRAHRSFSTELSIVDSL